MKEAAFRRRVNQLLADLSAFHVENPTWPGTPDVSCTGGWIELKVLRDWPKRNPNGLVRVPHFTQQQRLWHARWKRHGGTSWVLIVIGREVLLFDGAEAAEYLGFVTRERLYGMAHRIWKNVSEMDTGLLGALRPQGHGSSV